MTDIIRSLRLLRKNLGTTTAAVLSLVIGITLNATIFSVVDWLWLRSSPFSEPDQIVRLFASQSGRRNARLSTTPTTRSSGNRRPPWKAWLRWSSTEPCSRGGTEPRG